MIFLKIASLALSMIEQDEPVGIKFTQMPVDGCFCLWYSGKAG